MPDGFDAVIDPHESFDALVGLELLESEAEGTMRGRVRIRDDLRQPTGLLHGGVIVAVAESLASWGTWRGVPGPVTAVMGMSNDTNFLRPLLDGHLNSLATALHRGRTRWLWQVEARDDDGRLCAVTMVNIAFRTAPAGS